MAEYCHHFGLSKYDIITAEKDQRCLLRGKHIFLRSTVAGMIWSWLWLVRGEVMQIWVWAGMIGSILLLDLVLSGDNALILGAAAAGLPRRQRWYALVFGGMGAIVLRIAFASVATFVLNIPWIQTIGAIVLMVIAIKLLTGRDLMQSEQSDEDKQNEKSFKPRSLKSAALAIIVADVTMSLDNVLAVGAAANGGLIAIALGLFFSIIIIICGSALVAELITRFIWLLDLAAFVLGWTSATMIHDDLVHLASTSNIDWLQTISQPSLPLHLSWLLLLLALVTCSLVLIFDLYTYARARQAKLLTRVS
jgi:YjbE family integral membrane protein